MEDAVDDGDGASVLVVWTKRKMHVALSKTEDRRFINLDPKDTIVYAWHGPVRGISQGSKPLCFIFRLMSAVDRLHTTSSGQNAHKEATPMH